MTEGIKIKNEKIVRELMEEAVNLYFFEIEPRKEKGEIDSLEADVVLDNLAKAEDMSDNAPEKLNIIEAEINRMKRILERKPHSAQSAEFSNIAKKKQEDKFLTLSVIKAEKEEKVEEIKDKITGEIKEDKKNLLNFRINISKALEDLSDELKMEKEKIDELYIKSDAVAGEDYHKIIGEIIDLQKNKDTLDAKIRFYKELTLTIEPKTEINGAFIKGIIDEAEKDALLDFLKEEKEEVAAAVFPIHEEKKETDEERTERLNKDYLHPEDIFYDAFAKWFAEKEDLYDRGIISEKKFGQIESLRAKLTAPVPYNKIGYLGEIENAYDIGVITEKDYEKLYPLAEEIDKNWILYRSDEEKEKEKEDWIRYQRAGEEEDFLKNLDREETEAHLPVDEEDLKKQRELRKKAKKLGIQRKKRKFSGEEEEELEEIVKLEEKIPQDILEISGDANGFKALAKWYLKKLREQENYDEKARKYVEKLGKFLAEKNKKINEYNEAHKEHKKRIEEKKQELENAADDNIILRPIRSVKTGAKIKDLFELKEKFGKIIKFLEERLEDNYDRGKIKTREYNEKIKILKRIYKSGDINEAKSAVEDYLKEGIINKTDKKELLSVLNRYVKK